MENFSQKELAECYQPLFDLMFQEHDKILLVSEMDDIIRASLLVVENVNKGVNQNY